MAGWVGWRLSAIAARPEEPYAGCHPPTARKADLEAGNIPEMPVVSEGALCAVRADDQADGTAGDHAVQMGAS
jgi:hypothetical protein